MEPLLFTEQRTLVAAEGATRTFDGGSMTMANLLDLFAPCDVAASDCFLFGVFCACCGAEAILSDMDRPGSRVIYKYPSASAATTAMATMQPTVASEYVRVVPFLGPA